MLKINNARKSFGNNLLFQHLNLEIDQPGLVAITGKSGCGKTTLLSIMAGFDTFNEGILQIDENVAFIFQNYELINELNVQDNILLSKRVFNESEQELIKSLGLKDYLNYYPKELSGGQRQRVGIARALLRQPNIILCDEPTESLDIENKVIVMDLLKELSKHKIVVVVTHDLVTVEKYADVVYEMENQAIHLKKNEKLDAALQYDEKQVSHTKDVSWLVRQITWKRSLLFTISFLLLFGLWSTLYVFQQNMFREPTTSAVLNKDIVYIKSDYDQEHIASLLEVKALEVEPIFEFEHVNLEGVEYNCMIYPYQNPDNLTITGEEPNGFNVVANQLALEQLNLDVGDSLLLTYVVSGNYFEIESVIVGSILEPDAFGMSLYYDLDSLMELNKTEYVAGGISVYSYLMSFRDRNYQMHRSNKSIQQWYEDASGFQKVELFNPLYDYRVSLKENSAVFKLVYEITEMILLVGILFYMLLFLMKEVKYHQKNCSILSSMGIPFKQVKSNYLFEKMIFFYPFSLLIPLVCGISYLMKLMELQHLKWIMLAYIGFASLYWIVVFYFTGRWKSQQISSIIKEDL